MKIDNKGKIINNSLLAGILICSNIKDIEDEPLNIVKLKNQEIYVFENVKLWVQNGKIIQIGVYNEYQGKMKKSIGLGNSFGELKSLYGKVVEDDEDNLVVENLPGIIFETYDLWKGIPGNKLVDDNLDSIITEIFVYKEVN